MTPNTPYRTIHVTLVCPEEMSEAEIADGINETLRPAMITHGSECVFHDYSIDFGNKKIKVSGHEPEEGELLIPVTPCDFFS